MFVQFRTVDIALYHITGILFNNINRRNLLHAVKCDL
jgi:hypothetical protein